MHKLLSPEKKVDLYMHLEKIEVVEEDVVVAIEVNGVDLVVVPSERAMLFLLGVPPSERAMLFLLGVVNTGTALATSC